MDNASREPLHKSRIWIWHFDKALEAIWPLLPDTACFNETAGLPGHEIIETPREGGSVEYLARAHRNQNPKQPPPPLARSPNHSASYPRPPM